MKAAAFILTVLFLVCAVWGSAASASQQSPIAWPMFHGDLTHSGSSNSAAPTTNATLWKFNTGGQVDSPTVVSGVVYVGSFDHNIYAFNASDGSTIWSYKTGSVVISRPAVVNGVVYVGSEDHNLYALDAATGLKLWNYTTGYYVD